MFFRISLPCCLVLMVGIGNGQTVFEFATGSLPASAIGGNTMDAQVADFNGDGHPDIVLAKEWSRNRILFNDGTGKFTDVTIGKLSNVAYDSEDIAIADFDHNGWPDIVFAAEDDMNPEMYLNTGNGDFTDVSDRLPRFISNAVITLDVNGDTHPDLLFGNAGQEIVLINDGLGNFTDETSARLPVRNDITQDLLAVDVDLDGDLDMAVGNEDGNRLWIQTQPGIFVDETSDRWPQGVNMETRKIRQADVNRDGYPDLFFCNMASGAGRDIRDRLYLNDGSGRFTDVTDDHLPDELLLTFDADFADLNGDSYPDLVVGYFQHQMPAVLINQQDGTFLDETSDYLPENAAGNSITVVLIDLNGDTKKDLYLGCFQQSDKLYHYSASTSTEEENFEKNQFSIYPNPARDVIFISTVTREPFHLSIFDLNGHMWYAQEILPVLNSISIDLPDSSSGIHIARMVSPSRTESQKIVIQR